MVTLAEDPKNLLLRGAKDWVLLVKKILEQLVLKDRELKGRGKTYFHDNLIGADRIPLKILKHVGLIRRHLRLELFLEELL